MVEGIFNEDQGNWLRRLWALHLKDDGWPEVKEIECNARGQNTIKWIKEQCDLAKADVEREEEAREWEWSGDQASDSESDIGSFPDFATDFHDFPPDSPEADN